MITLRESNGRLCVLLNGSPAFRFEREAVIAIVGTGKAEYKMNRGSFRFKEKTVEKAALYAGEQKCENGAGSIVLKTRSGEVVFNLVVKPNGDTVRFHLEPLTTNDYNRLTFRLPAKADEHVYGCGETFTKFDLRGEKVRIWVAEHSNALRIAKKIAKEKLRGKRPEKIRAFSEYASYYAQPTFVSSNGYFLHVDSPAYMDFDFTHKDCHEITVRDFGDVVIGFADGYEGRS